MTTQDSDNELTGKVAAGLTPHVVHVPERRGEQSSGFFDLGSIFAMHVQSAPQNPLMPLRRSGPPPLPGAATALARAPHAPPRSSPPPLPARARGRQYAPRSDDVVAYLEVPPMRVPGARALGLRDDGIPDALRRKPIGWYAVFVTWLATSTLAALVATQVTGHVHVRSPALAAPPAGAPAPGSAAAGAPALANAGGAPANATTPVNAGAAAPSAATPATARPTPPSAPGPALAQAPAAAPSPALAPSEHTISVSDLPRAGAHEAAVARHAAPLAVNAKPATIARVSRAAASPPEDDADDAAPAAPAHAAAAATPSSASSPSAAHARAHAAAPAAEPLAPATAAAAPARAPAPPAAPAPAPGSLEDLIRKEVAAEQKKLHGGH